MPPSPEISSGFSGFDPRFLLPSTFDCISLKQSKAYIRMHFPFDKSSTFAETLCGNIQERSRQGI
jgi:hypothetical protein